MQWMCLLKALVKRMILLLPLVSVILLGCSTLKPGYLKMQVELDVFSGRSNPHWDLTPQEAKEFSSLFKALLPSKGERSVKEGLGYRGLIVTESGQKIEGYDEIMVSNGVVVARWDSESKQFTDKNRGLEQWLFQTGRGRLDNELYRQVSQSAQLN